jgi:transcriptional regulator with XRE-family HTH domain
MGKSRPDFDRIRDKLRQAVKDSGMTQEQIGLAMGFSKGGARQAVSRLLNSGIHYDPRLTTLIDLAKAIGKPLKDLV